MFHCVLPLFLVTGLVVGNVLKPEDGQERRQLEGMWFPVQSEQDAVTRRGESIKPFKFVFIGNAFVHAAPLYPFTGKFRLDSSQIPKAIDFIQVDGPYKGKTQKGIYEFSGTQLKLCYTYQPGNERPIRFSADERASQVFLILERFPTALDEKTASKE